MSYSPTSLLAAGALGLLMLVGTLAGCISDDRTDGSDNDVAEGAADDMPGLCHVFATRAGEDYSYSEHLSDDPPFTEGSSEPSESHAVVAEVYFAYTSGLDPGEAAPLADYLSRLLGAWAEDEEDPGPPPGEDVFEAAELVDETRASGACEGAKPIGER